MSCNMATNQKIRALWQQDWITKKLLQLPRKALCVENILKTTNVFGSHAAPVTATRALGEAALPSSTPTDFPTPFSPHHRPCPDPPQQGLWPQGGSGLLLSACPVFRGSSRRNQQAAAADPGPVRSHHRCCRSPGRRASSSAAPCAEGSLQARG